MTGCTGVDGTAGTRYTFAQLEGLWINAGGSKGLAPLMAAIALAESGGCSAAINPTDNSGSQTSWGLWQISDGTHNQPVANVRDPAINAQEAVAKYKDQGLSAWGTYNSGAYKAYMGSSTPDLNVPHASGTINTSGATTTASIEPYSSGTCILSFPGIAVPFLGNIGQFCLLPKHTARAIAGFGLMTAGFFIFLPGLALIALDVGIRSGAVGAIAGAAGRGPLAAPVMRATQAAAPAAPAAPAPRQTVSAERVYPQRPAVDRTPPRQVLRAQRIQLNSPRALESS